MKISSIVASILQNSREARNSDKELLISFMEHYGICLTDTQRIMFKEMPSLETARRIRQKFQEEGKYKADSPIGRERRFKGYAMQQQAPRITAEDVEKIIEQPHAIGWLND